MFIRGLTDIGVRYDNNQDTFWVTKFKVVDTADDGIDSNLEEQSAVDYTILAICDGMGGLADGSLASQTVIRAIRTAVVENNDFSKEGIYNAILSANEELLTMGKSSKEQRGTTCSVIVIGNEQYYGWHIGDSRIYQFRGKSSFKVLTEDHTALNVRRKRGVRITPEMVKKYRSTLSRCIGVVANPKIDYFEGTYLIGDTFVACSDGFWHYWDKSLDDFESQILEVKSKGEKDNISVVAVTV